MIFIIYQLDLLMILVEESWIGLWIV